jgi:hypothetical protein
MGWSRGIRSSNVVGEIQTVVKTESREPSDNKQQTGLKSLKTQAPSGGLFGIDQEVVTLRGLYGNSGIPDRPASGGSNPNSPVVCGL